jgi:hypothetical protein
MPIDTSTGLSSRSLPPFQPSPFFEYESFSAQNVAIKMMTLSRIVTFAHILFSSGSCNTISAFSSIEISHTVLRHVGGTQNLGRRGSNIPLKISSNDKNLGIQRLSSPTAESIFLSASLAFTVNLAATTAALVVHPSPSAAYVPSDYASNTVQAAVQELKLASGNIEATFKAYENIAGIITEGKGVGGMVNYREWDSCYNAPVLFSKL